MRTPRWMEKYLRESWHSPPGLRDFVREDKWSNLFNIEVPENFIIDEDEILVTSKNISLTENAKEIWRAKDVEDHMRRIVSDRKRYKKDTSRYRRMFTSLRKKFEKIVLREAERYMEDNKETEDEEKEVKNKMSLNELKGSIKRYMKEYYEKIYRAGVRSVGLRSSLRPEDREWYSNAIKQEFKYLDQLLDDLGKGKLRGGLKNRLSNYFKASDFMFWAGRVNSLPKNSVIYWVTKNDDKVCPSCRYLQRIGPFLPETLPTTPRAGHTVCRMNTRSRLVIKFVGKKQLENIKKKQKSPKEIMKDLDNIMSGKYKVSKDGRLIK